MAQPSKPQHIYPAYKPGHLLRRALTRLLCVLLALQPMLAQAAPALAPPATLQAGGHLSLLAPKLSARGDITLKAERGRVYLGAGKDTDYLHEDYSRTGWFKWETGEQGRYDETVRLPELRAGGTLRLEAGSGVVDYKLAGNLNESIASLSRLPELAWMGRLKGRADIDWRAIEAVHDHWQRHESGIGGPGVTLVALAVGAYLGGIDFSQLLGTGLEGSMAAGFSI